ncbi:hypothetical protein [Microcoleus sp. B5-D4]|uniref:hypothetical protein n=1 Tax=Microcoleus sp. B5-D4 TaxID=2818681 RepID=UPI002FD578C2
MPVPQMSRRARTGKMSPVPQMSFLVGSRGWASCPPMKDLLRMVPDFEINPT